MTEKMLLHAAKIRDLPNLPPVPLAAQEILASLQQETITVGQLVTTIERDPSLTSRIIGVANSAYFGTHQKIYSVNDAITRVLGTNNVFSIALGIVLAGPFKANKCPGFHLELYWAEALKTAILGQALAPYARNGEPDLEKKAYLCGLLHNIGLLVLAHTFPEKIASVVSMEAIEHDRDITEIEERLIGIDRRQAGAILARKWHIPDEIYAVIDHHHDLSFRGVHWKLAHLIGLCVKCSRMLAVGKACEPDPVLFEPLGLPVDTVLKAVERVRDKITDIHKMALMLTNQ
jgi:HD-like signal output (HDOD) protein